MALVFLQESVVLVMGIVGEWKGAQAISVPLCSGTASLLLQTVSLERLL